MWSVKDTRILALVSSGQFYFTFRSIRSILTGNSFLNLSTTGERSGYPSLSVCLSVSLRLFLCVSVSLCVSPATCVCLFVRDCQSVVYLCLCMHIETDRQIGKE